MCCCDVEDVSRIGVANPTCIGGCSGTPTWTPFATALYVTTDHFLIDNPQHRPWLRGSGSPRASKTPNWSPWPCCSAARIHLRGAMVALREQPTARAVPCLPTQSGYNKRLRAATGMLRTVIAHLVACTSRCTNKVWVVDSTPAECGRSRETTKRSDLAGWAEYGKRVALALLLGTASAPGVRPVGAAGGIRADRR